MTNDTDTPPANADAANNSESSRAAAVIEPSNGLWERAAAVLRQQVSEAVWFSTFSSYKKYLYIDTENFSLFYKKFYFILASSQPCRALSYSVVLIDIDGGSSSLYIT
ncbi:MAG: hypothetical protein ACKO97_12670, partial [Actinomycetota bacterium]